MYNTVFKINKAFIEQVEINMEFTFDYNKIVPIRKGLRENNTCVISLQMFY